MKQLFTILLLVFSAKSFAQSLKYDSVFLATKEDSLKIIAEKIQMSASLKDRIYADSLFKRTLVRALKSPHSFYYPFDSITTVSILFAPDSSFKIFTWHLRVSENLYLQKGAIQMLTYDGSLKLFGLIDKSEKIKNLADTVADHNGWVGAIYYKIIQKKYSNRDYYTLLGFDANNVWSDKKIAEVLTFSNDKPVFGGRYFSFEEDKEKKQGNNRFIIEYKKGGGARLNYDAELDMIVVEHLVPENNEPNRKASYVGDGDYEGFKWKNGKWVHVEKIFDYKTPEGKPPVPTPINNNSGNPEDDKLESKIPDQMPVAAPPAPVKKSEKKPATKPRKKG